MTSRKITRGLFLVAPLSLLLLVAAEPASQPAERTTASGLKIITVSEPTEPITAQPNDIVWVYYTGRLQSNGTIFDASTSHRDRSGDPTAIQFRLGTGHVIKGWDEGLIGMKVGEKRQLIVPPNLAYGAAGQGPIPANATLVFDVELVGVYREPK